MLIKIASKAGDRTDEVFGNLCMYDRDNTGTTDLATYLSLMYRTPLRTTTYQDLILLSCSAKL